MSQPLSPGDPAYWMLEEGRRDPSKRSTTTVYRKGCYICEDPEFALMGLPLCYPCPKCGGHVAADDVVCDVCGHDTSTPTDENAGIPHLRVVPENPSPLDFPPRAWPCDERNHPRFSPCPYCDVEVCAYGMKNAASEVHQQTPPTPTPPRRSA